jgi:hypothetical protein
MKAVTLRRQVKSPRQIRYQLPCVVFFILLITGGKVMCMPQGEKQEILLPSADSNFIPSTAGSFIPSSEIPSLELAAIKGDGEAANKLAKHFYYAFNDECNGDYWELIGAENGNINSAHNVATALLFYNTSDIRGIYWYRIAAKHGFNSSINALNLLGIPINFDIPDDSIFKQMPDYLTFEQIEQCEENALKGNGIAALVLANFYYKVESDNEKSEYWYRIGTQNGNNECQVSFGNILISKDDMLSQERGKFWLNRSVKK